MYWVKVDERLPTEEKRYLVMVHLIGQIRPTIEIAKRYTHNIPYLDKNIDSNFLIRGEVTHWMNLPYKPTN